MNLRVILITLAYLALVSITTILFSSPVAAQNTLPDTFPAAEIFIDVSDDVGIFAPHRGSWDQYHKYREFTDGYLASGQAWGDYNNDGWIDLYVTGGLTTSVLYQNDGENELGEVTFSISPLASSVALSTTFTGGAVWADIDNDGWKDLYVLAHGANVLFRNDQGNGFIDITDTAGVGDIGKSGTAAWGDYDGDSYLDLYVANWSCFPACDPVDHTLAQDHLYHNNGPDAEGNITFSDVSHLLSLDKLRGAGFTAVFVDYDNDRDPDLYVVNDKLYNPVGNVLWRNDGKDKKGTCGGWCWTDVSEETGTNIELHGMGLAVGDYDNDQDLDFHVTNMVDPNALLQNQNGELFTDMLESSGLPDIATDAVGWGTSFFDYDNDGWLDLYFATTAFIKYNDHEGPLGMMMDFRNFLFRNLGRGNDNQSIISQQNSQPADAPIFDDVTPQSWIDNPIPSMGFASADYDRDGRVDFIQADWKDRYRLYRNQSPEAAESHWLTVRLFGGGPVNRDAIGARVRLTLDDGRTLMQEVKSGSVLGSGNDTALHFGLGEASAFEAVVTWPNGRRQFFVNIPQDSVWHIPYTEPFAKDLELDPILEQIRHSYPEPFQDVTVDAGIDAIHRGTWRMFQPDFTHGYLGIGQAWGDYDNDGWLDLYVSGNTAPNVLYRNMGDGTFFISELWRDVQLADHRSGGAVWADYNNDGWKDLYVLAHGANVLLQNIEGAGFTNVTEVAGVGDTGKGSTATWGDYDNDGWLDLYVTNWACHPECVPLDFTLSQDRLYHNNGPNDEGEITFSDVSHLLDFPKLLGAGFTASFVDVDNDRDMDLYVVNDALLNPIGNVLWRNDGPDRQGSCGGWCWTDASEETGAGIVIEGMGLAVGDYDNDQDLDFYFSNMVNPSALMENQGNGSFVNLAKQAGVVGAPGATVGWGTSFFDYNNDGWLDLYMSTTEFRNYDPETPPDGMHFEHPNILFENARDGTFRRTTPTSWIEKPRRSMGIAYADYDQDGWMDFVTGDWNKGFTLYRNLLGESTKANWLTIKLIGSVNPGNPVNRDAIGTRVYLMTNHGHRQMQEVKSGSSLGAGNDTALHFGLGDAEIDSVLILWPNDEIRLFKNVPVNQVWPVGYEMPSHDFSEN
ncbi:MAG: FG-GAP-like repeat-containing protein [Chloroflexota bacterium]